MRVSSSRPFASLFTAILAAATLTVPAAVSRAETVIVEHNASVVVNGWALKGDIVTRRPDGVVKVVGNARASHDGHRCAGSADKIVLNTAAERITFLGGARVELDHASHVGALGAGLVFDYRHHTISAVEE